MVVVDDEDEEEGEKKTNLPTYSLTTAFSLNLADSIVVAKASTFAQA